MYYVYEWFIVNTGEIIYVGKGTRNRYKVRKHNRIFDEFIKRYNCDSRIIKKFDTEAEAFEFEYEWVNTLKQMGQCVCNINKGGSGGSTDWWTDDMRKRYSEHNVMKSELQRERMSKNNPMKNREIAEKSNSKKRRPVIIDGIKYKSVNDAMNAFGVCYDTIVSWCRKGINSKGQMCRFEDSEQKTFTDKRYNKGGSKAVVYLNKRYECIKDCADDVGVSQGTVSHWLKRGFDIKGNLCRYEGDTREYEYDNPFKGKPVTPITVNEIRYSSVAEASEKLGVAKTTLYAYLQGRRKGTKYICAYDNQQPSHGNTDNSTVEGSTTNG